MMIKMMMTMTNDDNYDNNYDNDDDIYDGDDNDVNYQTCY